MFGPGSSGYPGKYAFYCFAVFVAGLYGVVLVHFFKLKKPFLRETSVSLYKDSLKDASFGQVIVFGIVCLLLIGIALWSIYAHRPF
jgi:formate/nitrite transporter FocA (FNT family)